MLFLWLNKGLDNRSPHCEEYDMVGIPELTNRKNFCRYCSSRVASKEDISAKVKSGGEYWFRAVKNYWPIKYVGEGNTATQNPSTKTGIGQEKRAWLY